MDNIIYENGDLKILDQTLPPNEEKYITMKSLEECIEAIKSREYAARPPLAFLPVIRLRFLTEAILKPPKRRLTRQDQRPLIYPGQRRV